MQGLRMQPSEFPRFSNLTLEDKPLLGSLLKEAQPQISELSFTNLFVWNASEPVQTSEVNETVLIQRRRLRDGKTFLLPPLGKRALLEVMRSLRALSLEGELPPFYGFAPQQVQLLENEFEKVEPDRDDWDYVYLTRDLADLPGDKYHPKRNFISRCLSKYECRYANIGPNEIEDCLQLQTRWCNLRNCSEVQGLEAENTAIKTAFENYERLGIFGGAVYVDDKLEAFTLSEPLNDDTAVIHFEKANPEIEGLYQLVNQWFCQKALGKFKYVNREQDLGIPGLRKAKESYYPHHMVKKHIVHLAFERGKA
jgi:hypothetical protein